MFSADDAASIWGIQRSRESNAVEVYAKSFGYDTVEVTVRIPRKSPGIGLVLEEFGSDGECGLVVVESCVPGGNAASSDIPIEPGDVLISAGSVGGRAVSVEALPYDATVGVLGSLDPEMPVELVLRRLVRLPRLACTITFPQDRADEKIDLLPGMPLRRTILSKGIKLNDPLARRFDAGWGTGDCGGEGTCCTCALQVVQGIETLTAPDAQERQMLSQHSDWRLACKARVADLDGDTELVLRVAPRQGGDSD